MITHNYTHKWLRIPFTLYASGRARRHQELQSEPALPDYQHPNTDLVAPRRYVHKGDTTAVRSRSYKLAYQISM